MISAKYEERIDELKRRKLRIGIDVDEVLAPCNEYAIPIVNNKHGTGLIMADITAYDYYECLPKEIADSFIEIYNDPEFFKGQRPYPGAVELVNTLIKRGHEVIFASATFPHIMGIRAKMLADEFPNVPSANIMLGARKDLLNLDVLLDDKPENLIESSAKFPIAFRRPWNQKLTGFLSVDNYEEFIEMVDQIANNTPRKIVKHGQPYIISLVGPSGSGKTAITETLIQNPAFKTPRSHTTRERRPSEGEDYYFVDKYTFADMVDRDEFLENTEYADNLYGLHKEELFRLWEAGKHAVAPIDINGAMAFKSLFGDRALTVFIHRSKQEILEEIISRSVSTEDKVKRIMSLDAEYANEAKCDFAVINNGTIEDAAGQIMSLLL
jgi:guanylate kinase